MPLMLTNERQFRVVQVWFGLVVLVCFQVALKVNKTCPEITPFHWVVIGMGVWGIVSGFMFERRMVSYPNRVHRPSTRSTPIGRWRAANLMRLASAASVACWGLVLRETSGPALIAYVSFAVAGLLILIWKPSAVPR